MTLFKELPEIANIQELIQSTFDTDLSLSGGWGYTKKKATLLHATYNHMPLSQFEHMIASIRTHLEMNITQEKVHRYAGINLNEISRDRLQENTDIFDKVTYEITAIEERRYMMLIKEYKEGYGKEDFDLNKHFNQRENATLKRKVTYYFEVSKLI